MSQNHPKSHWICVLLFIFNFSSWNSEHVLGPCAVLYTRVGLYFTVDLPTLTQIFGHYYSTSVTHMDFAIGLAWAMTIQQNYLTGDTKGGGGQGQIVVDWKTQALPVSYDVSLRLAPAKVEYEQAWPFQGCLWRSWNWTCYLLTAAWRKRLFKASNELLTYNFSFTFLIISTN